MRDRQMLDELREQVQKAVTDAATAITFARKAAADTEAMRDYMATIATKANELDDATAASVTVAVRARAEAESARAEARSLARRVAALEGPGANATDEAMLDQIREILGRA